MSSRNSPSDEAPAARSLSDRIDRFDRRFVELLARWGIPMLRVSLGLVFVWFGALKVARVSPVADLVARTVYWVDPAWFVPVLGVVEVIIGAGLLAGRALRTVLALFWLQMLGTFLVLVIQPDVAFQRGNPLLLTVEGEFVVKNLVLLSAGMVVGSTARRRKPPRVDTHRGLGTPPRATG
jgi:putative oxidoreductase